MKNFLNDFLNELINYVEAGDFTHPFTWQVGGELTSIRPNDATEIYQAVVSNVNWIREQAQTIEEQADFIRLLRKENKELRGNKQ